MVRDLRLQSNLASQEEVQDRRSSTMTMRSCVDETLFAQFSVGPQISRFRTG